MSGHSRSAHHAGAMGRPRRSESTWSRSGRPALGLPARFSGATAVFSSLAWPARPGQARFRASPGRRAAIAQSGENWAPLGLRLRSGRPDRAAQCAADPVRGDIGGAHAGRARSGGACGHLQKSDMNMTYFQRLKCCPTVGPVGGAARRAAARAPSGPARHRLHRGEVRRGVAAGQGLRPPMTAPFATPPQSSRGRRFPRRARGTAATSSATATGSSTPPPSGGSSTRPRSSSSTRATTTAPG